MNKKIFYLSVLLFNVLFITKVNATDVVTDYNNIIISNRLIGEWKYTGKLVHVHVGEIPAYGLEPTKAYGENYYIDNNFLDKFSKDDLNYFKLVSYYGYNDKNSDLSYYMAAQSLIWSRITGQDVYWTNLNNEIIDIENYKNEIVDNINNHYLKPSFSEQNISGNLNEVIELVDTNSVLDNYEIEYNGENEIWKEENKLYIKIKSRKDEKINLIKKVNNNIDDKAYITAKGQSVGVFGINEVIESSFTITPNNPGSQIKISFDNVEYNELSFKIKDIGRNTYFNYQGTDIFSIKDGMYLSDFYLDDGEYEIELVDVPSNYIIDIENKNFKVDSKNSVINFDIKLTKVKGNITINRLFNGIDINDKSNYIDYKIPNLIYYLYAKEDILDKDGNVIYLKDQLVDTFKSDINGQATSDDIEVGNYYIVEGSSSDKYINYNDKIDVSITADDSSTKLINEKLEIKTSYNNLYLELDVSEELEDGYQKENLENVEYGLYAKEQIFFIDKILFSKGELIKTFKTNGKGLIKENVMLPYGNYFIRKLSEQGNNNFIDYIFEYNGQNQINSFEIEKNLSLDKNDEDNFNTVEKNSNKIESNDMSVIPELETNNKINDKIESNGTLNPELETNDNNKKQVISNPNSNITDKTQILPNTNNKYFKYYAISIILIVIGTIGLKYKKV